MIILVREIFRVTNVTFNGTSATYEMFSIGDENVRNVAEPFSYAIL